ncbi:MAG: hypothetical protein M3Y49_05885 [Actinomycetota bacterium]|nr:hypothetical protein [Actinomycetota bacterium]
MAVINTAGTNPAQHSFRLFILVAFAGGLWLMAVLGMLTIGVFIAPVAVAATAWLIFDIVKGRWHPACALGLIASSAAVPTYFAWLSAGHPGVSSDVFSSDGLPNPLVFAAIAVALCLTAVSAFTLTEGRRRQAGFAAN